ncbi:MAG: CBS domain-containing protein [Proteobacteria bacterium]|nr:CBS domain-containing protein [Pseudomonadota bacterium]
MNLIDCCRREIVYVDASASLQTAAALMREHHVGALLVTTPGADRQAHACGIVTDRDLAIEVLARGADPGALCIGQVASATILGVPARASVEDAVLRMEQSGVRRLLVTDEDGGVLGILSVDDVVAIVAAELGGLSRALQGGIAREVRQRAPIEAARPRPMFLPHGTPAMRWPAMGAGRAARPAPAALR